MDFATLALDRGASPVLYRQLSDQLADAIGRGELAAGDRLPSERDLAMALGVSRTTAVNAYRELEARGLIRGYVGRGTFVCAASSSEPAGAPFAWRGKLAVGAQRTLDPTLRSIVRAASDPAVISFAAGIPALECFPTEAFREITDRVLRRGARTAVGLAPTDGQPALRRAIASRASIRPEQVLIVAGAQQGLDLVARCLLDPGDAVVIDRPGYLGAIQAFRAAGAHLVGWDAGQGDLDELEDLLLRYRPKLLYTTTTFQNPTGLTWPLPLRRDLLELTARYRLPVVEDEPYRDLSFGAAPPPSLFALDGGRSVIHVGTFSKTLAGGLRLGWVTANEAIVDQLALVKLRDDVSTASLTQLVIAELLTSGRFDRHLAELRAEHSRRHQTMLAALRRHVPTGALNCRPVNGGLYLWCRLHAGLDARDLFQTAAAAGVAYVAGDHFYPDGAGANELRLCFSSVPAPRIEEGVRRLGSLIGGHRHQATHLNGAQPLV
ncbi:MAG: 2-aminoadipate transaminase [Thermomicrobiales bacterium]|nr:2-aminoadipate transaminase [Thermomicrobiales bacterium]